MKVAFWSNVRGRSCVTSNLACISVLSALSRPAEKTIIFENHQNIINLGSTLFSQNSDNEVNEVNRYTVEQGLGKVMKLVEEGKILSEECFFRFATDYLGKRLFYLPAGGVWNPDFLEYQMDKDCIRTMNYLELYSDLVMVDTSAASLASSRKILQQADVVVVNLTQNEQMLSHFFRNYASVQAKAFYLIGNYDMDSQLSKSYIVNNYHVQGDRIGTVPHNTQYSDAISSGRIIPFFLKNYECSRNSKNYPFFAMAKEAVELFRNHLVKQ